MNDFFGNELAIDQVVAFTSKEFGLTKGAIYKITKKKVHIRYTIGRCNLKTSKLPHNVIVPLGVR